MTAVLKLPISVIVTTKNEAQNIARCLTALSDFDEVIVVDSHSTDDTAALARAHGARVEMYQWDGHYPKKRQWCLDHLAITHDWVFWVDADEVVTAEMVAALTRLFQSPRAEVGFFIKGRYVWGGQVLRYGLHNNKIALFHRHKMHFPIVDDLNIDGMGEIEGHYQPVRRDAFAQGHIGQVAAPLLHYAYDDAQGWHARHDRYAMWEAAMIRRKAFPIDPIPWREGVKRVLRRSRFKPLMMFAYSYIWAQGFRDGHAGLSFARSRFNYARDVFKYLT